MANNKSTYLESALLDAVLRNISFTSPSAVYLALFTVTPLKDGTGGTEVSGGSYARQAITYGAPVTNIDLSVTVSNSGLISFPVASASWGNIVSVGVYDASTSGNLLYVGTVAVAKTIGNGDQVTFPAASLTLTET